MSVWSDARAEAGGGGGAGEAQARRALLRTAGALAAAVRAPPPLGPPRAPAPPPATPASAPHETTPQRHHPPLTHTLYDVFRHLALEFHYQVRTLHTGFCSKYFQYIFPCTHIGGFDA